MENNEFERNNNNGKGAMPGTGRLEKDRSGPGFAIGNVRVGGRPTKDLREESVR